jgi:hypothetical protein
LDTKEESDESDDEKALFGAQFKGHCQVCGKWVHKGMDCHLKDSNSGGSKPASNNYKKFEGECHYCHKKSYMKKDCFKKKKDDGEQANQVTDLKKKKKKKKKNMKVEDESEIVLMVIDNESEFEMVDTQHLQRRNCIHKCR